MKFKSLALSLLISLPALADSSVISCTPKDQSGENTSNIWPVPYLSNNKLCFNMTADSGSTCVANKGSTSWFTEAVIVNINGEPQGRDDTWFRVVHPTVTDNKIEYLIEGSRDQKNWGGVSHVSINRLTGEAVDWFIVDQGGISYQCHLEKKKI
ncbi:hypothetical protein [Escherichia coli]|uniref:hypothetical protein n=1 Tax=Escherichia coli TaxID=562 RepID=UPI000BE5B2A1|nr:hypothetical protein [Escherichia coli]EEX1840731.1 hypothetical protein [Escherichia coli]